ncbi:MAG: riboflavin synthase [Candidatus Meridianibacter frigidus]|nr:MAG: riboflavin synthase [Candidatus Eremiobacteraeota bacterium]
MFSGLIACRGEIVSLVELPGGGLTLCVQSSDAQSQGIALRDSVCVNGVCLTVAAVQGATMQFDVVPETGARSTLAALRAGERVNVELSLRLGERLGGHFVYGHVDSRARVLEVAKEGQGKRMTIERPPPLSGLICEKAFVSVDGVSVTVAGVEDGAFSIVLVPETLASTTLGERSPGSFVNLEADPLARYAAHAALK